MIPTMRLALGPVVLVGAIACGGPDVEFPRDRAAPIRLVECRPAQPLPTMSAELFASRGPDGGGRGMGIVTLPKLKLTITDVTIEAGTFDPLAVKRGLAVRLPNLQTCYARDLSSPSLKAKSLRLRFTIGVSGTIAGVREVADGRISTPACIRSMLEGSSIGQTPRAGSVLVSVALRADLPGAAATDAPAELASSEPWTPFAVDKTPPTEMTSLVARAAETAVRGKLEAMAACFPPKTPTGSLRLLLELGEDGELIAARAGGLGLRAVDECVRKATAGLRVVSPSSDPAEIACDLARGDAEAWRIAPDAGYRTIVATKTGLAYGSQALPGTAPAAEPLDDEGSYLVAADPDTNGSVLLLALSWAYESTATIVALRDPSGKLPPRYLGMGHNSLASADTEEDEDVGILPALRLGPTTLTACVNRTTQSAKLSEPSLVSALLHNVAAKCRTIECARTLVVALEPQAVARDLVEVTGAARRAGFDRVLIGGDVCGVGGPARRGGPDDDDDDDDFLDEEED